MTNLLNMKRCFFGLLLALGMLGCQQHSTELATVEAPSTVNIIPQPAQLTVDESYSIVLPDTLTIVAPTPEAENVATLLETFLSKTGFHASIVAQGPGVITLDSQHAADSLGEEGYTLTTSKAGITLSAATGAGLFYAAQSFIQLINEDHHIAAVTIADQPRFAYRGLHLDVCRHFFPADFVKKYIDLMSHYKFNTFHWHLTEDQGWRIEIKKYPRLQEVAAYRDETLVGHAAKDNHNYDGIRHGGYYTQEEIKDVVAYAAARHVEVIPEIEMPGHALAALAAYPYLGCTGGPYKVTGNWGVFKDVYCAGKDSTFAFLEDVIDEVVTLFPSKYIHIGGDECPKDSWKESALCQQRMKDEHLKDEHELQSYFIQRMEKYINSKGKRIIGWDEILEGGLAPDATVMSWRGEEGGIEAAGQHHDVIMTPGNWCYLDHYQADRATEPLAIGGFTPVKEVYGYEPIPADLPADQAKYILGAQCNVWTEYIPTTTHVEYMVYPRAIAMSEVVWSPKESRNYDSFVKRMDHQRTLLDLWDVNYAKHMFTEPNPETPAAQ